MKRVAFLIVAATSLFFFSCQKSEPVIPEPPQTMDELTVPGNFSWKTTRDFQLTVKANTSGLLDVLNDEKISYSKVFLTAGQEAVVKFTVPTYVKKVLLRYQGTEVSLELTSENLSYSFR